MMQNENYQTIKEVLLWFASYYIGVFLFHVVFGAIFFGATFEFLIPILGYSLFAYFVGKARPQKYRIYILILIVPAVYQSLVYMIESLNEPVIFYLFWSAVPLIIYRVCLLGSRVAILVNKKDKATT